MPDPSPPLWISFELDPGTADFFSLPLRLHLPAEPELSILGGDGRARLSLEILGRGLEAAVARNPEMAARADLIRFLHRWPRYRDLERYLEVGNADFARAVARNLLDDDPRDAPALAALGAIEARDGRWEEAVRLAGAAREVAPTHAPTRLQLALALAGAGRREEALLELEDLTRHLRFQGMARLWRHEVAAPDPARLPRLLRETAFAFFALQGEEAGDEARGRFETAFPANPEVLYTRAVSAPDLDDDARAELLARALESEPGHVPAVTALAAIHRRSGRPEDALRILDGSIGAGPGDPRLTAARGQALEQLGRTEEARRAYAAVFEEPLALLPAATLLVAGLGALRLLAPGASRKLLEDAAEARPGDPLPHQLLARSDERLLGRDAAERRLREAIRDCGPVPVLEYALADLLRRSGRRVEAEGLIKVLSRRHPDSPWGHRGLGDLAVEEQPAAAIEHYGRAAGRDPLTPIPGFDYLLGVAALRAGRAEEARRRLERAVAAEPDRARYWCDLGAAWFYEGDLDRALACTARAAALEPGHPGFLHNLAVYHQARFRRRPLTAAGSGWRAWGLRRRAARAAAVGGWRKDLWPGPEPEAPPRDS